MLFKKASINHEGARHCRKPLGRRSVTKGPIHRFFDRTQHIFLGNGNNTNIFLRISDLYSRCAGREAFDSVKPLHGF